MKKVQRYSCGNGEGMFDSKKGYWVTHEDYKNLLDKYNELKQVKNNGVLDDVNTPLKDIVFKLANKLAIDGKGEQAVAMHVIHNSL